MALLVLAHIDAHHGVLVVKKEFRQGARQFRFADAGRTQENEGTNRAVGVLHARTRAAHRVGNSDNSFILPNNALMQAFFHVQQLLHFAFQQAVDRDASPLTHHRGDFFRVDLFL